MNRLPRTTAILEEGIAQGIHLGAQVFVARAGEVYGDFGIGMANLNAFMTPDTLALWMSACKPIGAIAIAMLMERSRLQLSDPVADFIPEFADRGKESVTIRHLLTHTAGLRYVDSGWPNATWSETIDRICRTQLEPNWIPGQRARYDAANSWFLLGEIVRRLDGRPYETFVRDEIFLPLGMNDSWIGMPVEQSRAYSDRLGVLYATDKSPMRPLAPYDTEAAITRSRPAANGRGPVRELGRFYQMLLNGGSIPPTPVLRYSEGPELATKNPALRSTSEPAWRENAKISGSLPSGGAVGDPRLLSAETVRLFTSAQRIGMYDETFRHKIDWGLGFLICSNRYGYKALPYSFGPHASDRAFGHNGFQSTMAFADPEHELVVAIAPNGAPGEAAHDRRLRHVLAAVYEDVGIASGA